MLQTGAETAASLGYTDIMARITGGYSES